MKNHVGDDKPQDDILRWISISSVSIDYESSLESKDVSRH